MLEDGISSEMHEVYSFIMYTSTFAIYMDSTLQLHATSSALHIPYAPGVMMCVVPLFSDAKEVFVLSQLSMCRVTRDL